MKSVLIASFDMEIGGVERSLASMLNNFDYKNNKVDLILHSHTGELMDLLPENINLLPEIKKYKTFRMGIKDVFTSGNIKIGLGRILGKLQSKVYSMKTDKIENWSEYQYIWKRTIKYLPKIEKEYDVAISYLWPHNFVLEKVKAKKKIAWIHTDYLTVNLDREEDLKVWNKYDFIASISNDCTKSFLKVYPSLKEKIVLVENITFPKFIGNMSGKFSVQDFRKENFNILSVGRFVYQKGFDLGIEALKILKERGYKDIKWYVVGYGGDEEQLKELVKKYSLENDFIFLGKQSNPYPYMKECDLYVQPSRYEGKAVTVIEAQILNKPVLITDYPTAKSQIVDGEDGEIIELSVKGIADGIEKFYKNRELLKKYEINCKNKSFENTKELEKLYELF